MLFGLVIALGHNYPKWFGWVAVAAGILSVRAGTLQAYAGEPTEASRTLTIIGPTVITLWLLVAGATLIQRARAISEGPDAG